jgi:UDP-N-acetyl-D-mannosaminuronic acid dehydrogenase
MLDAITSVCMVGMGYIGLPTAAVLASRNVHVVGVDVNQYIVDTINQGQIHIVEPDLDQLVRQTVYNGCLRASTTPEPADVFIIAVPTPFKGEHQPDLSYIESAARSIAPVLVKGNLIILESTSPVGTTEQMAEWLASQRPDLSFPQTHGEASDIRVAYCPERVLPGHVLHELICNDRVIGGMTPRCADAASRVYKTFLTGACVISDARTAEMCKLTENSFRDTNIAFANELSILCDRLGINVWELIRLANRHPRVNILQPGPGVGGHCIAVDPWFIVDSAPEDAKLIRAAREVNDRKPGYVIDQIKQLFNAGERPTIACLGLSFKPDIDDLRESPAVGIVSQLASEDLGCLLVVEPHIDTLPNHLAGYRHVLLTDLETAIQQADIVVLLVNHQAFLRVERSMLAGKKILDTRGAWQ